LPSRSRTAAAPLSRRGNMSPGPPNLLRSRNGPSQRRGPCSAWVRTPLGVPPLGDDSRTEGSTGIQLEVQLTAVDDHTSGTTPIIVVSGLPRSGTSLMMQMLAEGGVRVVTDERREADDSNPRGYFEFEKVKELEGGDHAWLSEARGGAVKIIAFLLRHLPRDHEYRVIFMRRDLDEILASQAKMLARSGQVDETDDDLMRGIFKKHLAETERLLASEKCFDVLDVSYNQIIAEPLAQAERVNDFLGGRLDVQRMASAVSSELYRNRSGSSQ